jgi:hypothetical protein
MAALIGVVVLFVFVLGAAAVMFVSLNRAPKRHRVTVHKTKKKNGATAPTYRHIGDLLDLEVVEPGVIYAGGKYLAYARVEGTNFSILSDGERDIREDVLIGLQNQIKHPQQFVTSTVVIDTERAAQEVKANAIKTDNEHLSDYSMAYAGELEEMKRRRLAMAQVTWLVIGDDGEENDPGQSLRVKMSLMQELYSRSGLRLTPLAYTEEIIDAMQQIMLPERLFLASETAAFGLNPVKFNIKELEKLV